MMRSNSGTTVLPAVTIGPYSNLAYRSRVGCEKGCDYAVCSFSQGIEGVRPVADRGRGDGLFAVSPFSPLQQNDESIPAN